MKPPRLAKALIALSVPRSHREFVIGDLNEEFEKAAARPGRAAASRWYWREALITVITQGCKNGSYDGLEG